MSYRVLLESKVNAELVSQLFVFLEENLPNVRSFKGCMSVTVLFDKDSHSMVFDEEWKSKDDHQAYISFIDGNGILESLAGFLQGPPTIKYFKKMEI